MPLLAGVGAGRRRRITKIEVVKKPETVREKVNRLCDEDEVYYGAYYRYGDQDRDGDGEEGSARQLLGGIRRSDGHLA
jgi:hypothetical protein